MKGNKGSAQSHDQTTSAHHFTFSPVPRVPADARDHHHSASRSMISCGLSSSPNMEDTQMILSPVSGGSAPIGLDKDVSFLYSAGISPLAVLTSREVECLLRGVSRRRRSSENGVTSRSPSHSGVSTTATTVSTPLHDGHLHIDSRAFSPSPSPASSEMSFHEILSRSDAKQFRRDFTLRLGASPPTPGCTRYSDSTTSSHHSRHTLLCSSHEENQRANIIDECQRSFDCIAFSFSKLSRTLTGNKKLIK